MPTRKKISPAERRYMNHLRIESLRVGSVYEAKLARERRKELKRVLAIAMNYDDPEKVPDVLADNLSEGYLTDWWQGLWMAAGVPRAQTTARDLQQAKAAGDTDMWKATLRTYATRRAGQNIVSVTGTWKKSLLRLLRFLMDLNPEQGVEKLTKKFYQSYMGMLEKWQCRRIAQTETMIGTAQAGHLAAKSLDIRYTKQWCTSGLSNVRDSHAAVDGVTVDEDEPFKLLGGLLMFPHDTSLGADASEIINCACDVIRRPKSDSEATAAELTPQAEPVDAKREKRIKEFMDQQDQTIPEDVRRAKAENWLDIEKGLKMKKGDFMSVEEADELHGNPHFLESRSYMVNCQTCSPTYVLRTWGFDVTAGPNAKREGNLSYYLSKSSHFWEKWKNIDGTAVKHTSVIDWMKQNNLTEMTAESYFKFYDEMTKSPGIYEVACSWQSGGGHSTLLQRFADGTLKRIDAQTGMNVVFDAGNGLCTKGKKVTRDACDGILRVDDKLFDKKFLKIFRKVTKKKK